MHDLQHELYALLSKYEFYPSIDLKPKSDSWLVMPTWRPLLLPLAWEGQMERAAEYIALADFMSTIESGEWERVRKCPICQKWFYAQSKKKLVCSNSCRFRKYQANGVVRDKRREYMRSYFRHPKVKTRLRLKRKARSTGEKGV
jgi:hypothetical protein